MWKQIFSRWIFMAMAVIGAGTLPAEEPGLLPPPEQGLLILRNGQLFQGQISRVGDLYYVALPEGEIRLKAADVDVVCRDLEEGYLRKRAGITVETVYEHLRLAQWCQRHKLFSHAFEEIAEARKIDPHVAAIDVMENRLRLAMEPPPQSPPPAPPGDGVSSDELDRLVRNMPAGTVETFAQVVQPILMNNCTAAGCHGPQSETSYRLVRLQANQPASRRMTQRNLYETLKWIDFDKPEQSRLLGALSGQHGKAKGAAPAERHAQQYQRVALWLCDVSQRPMPETASMAAKGDKKTTPSLPASDGFGLSTAVKQASHVEPAKKGATSPVTAAVALEPVEEPKRTEGNADSKKPHERPVPHVAPAMPFMPADSFDPEIFNRKFSQPKEAGKQ